jgi:peptidoglycan/LPS O-acetylase OafA/YrhL
MVMAHHMAYRSWVDASETVYSILNGAYAYPELVWPSRYGWVGVQVFFVISGLVISCSARGATALEFGRRRFLRLFPGALVSATLTLAVALAIAWKPVWELAERYLRSVLFVPFGPWMDDVYWTLGIEVSFYTVVWLVLLARHEDIIEYIVLAVGASSAAYFFAKHFQAWPSRKANLLLLHHGVYFALGSTIWHALQRGWTWLRIVSFAAFGVVGFMSIMVKGSAGLQAAMIWSATVATMIVMLRYDDALAAGLKGIMPAIRSLSLATYPLYLIHGVVSAVVMTELAHLGAGRFLALAAAFALILALSVGITAGPERALRNVLARIPLDKLVLRATSAWQAKPSRTGRD